MGRPKGSKNGHITLITKTCERCGEPFQVRPYRADTARYCSKTCYFPPRPEVECEGCGKMYVPMTTTRGRFCSNECRRRRVKKTCPGCGKTFKVRKSKAGKYTYCSLACHQANTERVTLNCDQCGIAFEVVPSRADSSRFCSNSCRGEWQSEHYRGPQNHNWRGGYQKYKGPSWRKARRLVLARDRVCQDCGISPEELGRELDVHHIRPFRDFGLKRHKEANDPANLIALCPSCHLRREPRIAPHLR